MWYNNNNDSEIVNMHLYDNDFAKWTAQSISGLPDGLGSMATEAGCRWYQGQASSSGDPLSVINWMQALRAERAVYIPGVFLAWELMVGNSNTRWHWGSHPGTPEPASNYACALCN